MKRERETGKVTTTETITVVYKVLQETKTNKQTNKQTNNLVVFNAQTNYTDEVATACWRSLCQLFRVEKCHIVSGTVFSTGAATFSFK
jgi:hypothetical protein